MSKSPSILIVESDESLAQELSGRLQSSEGCVEIARSCAETLNLLQGRTFDLILCDSNPSDLEGTETLKLIRRSDPESTVIVWSSTPSVQAAVEFMRLGAVNYLDKSSELEKIPLILSEALRKRRVENQVKKNSSAFDLDSIVGESLGMQRVLNMVRRVAPTDSTVLIHGESGTGKELIAKAIHHLSARNEGNLVALNCGAIPPELLESELFGFEKGAFTGAHRTRIGRFEMADKGTIFLDEIGDMPLTLQVKMLRVLQERTIDRVGGGGPIRVDVRVIAATHQDLPAAIQEKRFREDLYYRLNVFPIEVPPLRERKSDIPLLAQTILERFRFKREHDIEGFSEEVTAAFMEYHWPGNVRELENIIERAVIMKDGGLVRLEDLPEGPFGAFETDESLVPEVSEQVRGQFHQGEVNFSTAVTNFERQLILEALDRTNWVKNRAAKLLDMKRTTLVEKMKRINLEKDAQVKN